MDNINIKYNDYDFIGFTFNGKHSSDFGLLRISEGDRYEDNLVPDLSNDSGEIPGGAGKYYYGEQIKERKFAITVAYDNLTELDKRRIKKWLHPDNKLHELIFDEKPYVKYWVKCNKEVNAKELCFNDDYYDKKTGKNKIRRIYKGEFSIEFIAFMPWGVVVDKDLAAFESCYNIDQWSEASGLIKRVNYPGLDEFNNNMASIYNPGDIESGFVLEFDKDSAYISLRYTGETTNMPPTSMGILTTQMEADFDFRIEKYYVYVSYDNKQVITGTLENAEAGNLKGYIENKVDGAKFIDNNTGNVYDIYIWYSDNTYYKYTITNGKSFSFNENSLIYGIDSINLSNYSIYELNILDKNSSTITINFPKHKNMTTPPEYLFVAPNTNSIINIGIKEGSRFLSNYNFSLNIPGFGNINPKYWNEAQKLVYYKCKVKIDTDKKTISYLAEGKNEWTGVAGILSQGNLFKIPIENKEDMESWNSPSTFKKFAITMLSSGDEVFKIQNPIIEYTYLYI